MFNVTGTTLTVRLGNVGANGYVLADAVRLEWVGPLDNAQLVDEFTSQSDAVPEEEQRGAARDEAFLITGYEAAEAGELATVHAAEASKRDSDHLPGAYAVRGPADRKRAPALDAALGDWPV